MKLLFCPQLCTPPPGPSLLSVCHCLGLPNPGQGFRLPQGCVHPPRPAGSCRSSSVPPSLGSPKEADTFEMYVKKHSDATHQGTKQNWDSFIEAVHSVSVAKAE